ncbi:MAG: DUF4230 domain-containing protein [Eubacteriales bacterium]|nr:DUF4230 domain-containing protein [Eubacteriales bacterium]
MRKPNLETSRNNGKIMFIKQFFTRKLIAGIIIVLVIAGIIIGVQKFISSVSKTTKIGFEDIGELATQSVYCTEVNVTDASRKLFGVDIPFTQSKYIYSYDIVIKAGYDFEEIGWDIDKTTIKVKLPEVQILSSEINMDSFKLYHEEESVFRQITMSENNAAIKSMKENAEENAIANGLLDNARCNAETILTSFFANAYNLEKYEIIFEGK